MEQRNSMAGVQAKGGGIFEYRGHTVQKETIPGKKESGYRVQGFKWWNKVVLNTMREAKTIIDAWEESGKNESCPSASA